MVQTKVMTVGDTKMTTLERLRQATQLFELEERIYQNRMADRPYPFAWVETNERVHVYSKSKEEASLIAEKILDIFVEAGYSVADATIQRHERRLFEATVVVNPCYSAQ